jgi:polyphosphate kinase
MLDQHLISAPLEQTVSADPLRLDSPLLYINRELSWLPFNERVLAQARDERHPLLERVKFLAIVGTKLDEFFMIRVAALYKQLRTERDRVSTDGLTTEQQVLIVRRRDARRADPLLDGIASARARSCRHPVPRAARVHARRVAVPRGLLRARSGARPDTARLRPGHPFPHISNLSKNLAVVVKHEGRTKFARIKLPHSRESEGDSLVFGCRDGSSDPLCSLPCSGEHWRV